MINNLSDDGSAPRGRRRQRPKWHTIEVKVQDGFLAVAKKFQLEPDHLAKVLCEDFQRHPPKSLTIVSTMSKD